MSGRSIAFVVIGDPAPQGSKRFVGKGVMVESSKRVKPWREAVAGAAYEARAGQAPACGLAPLDGPLLLRVTFWLPQPTSLSKRKAALGPFRKPDLSKLIRSTEDALTTAGVIADDARIVRLEADKRFTPMSGHTGAKITVEEIGS